jgi:hypothetical protein
MSPQMPRSLGADRGTADESTGKGSNNSKNSLPVNYRDRCPLICAGGESCTRSCPAPSPWPANVVNAIDCDATRCIPERRDCPAQCIYVIGEVTA